MFSSSIRATILKAMRTWENVTCIKFVEREPQHLSYLNFTIKACGCCSFVGRQNERMSQTISIGPGCQTHGIVLHELGHALGFWHEQSRADRDAFVEIFEERISPSWFHNFQRMDNNAVDSMGEPYDYESIMHYPTGAFAKAGENETMRPTQCCPRPPIGQRIKLSRSDIRQANMLYRCPSCGRTLLEFSGTFASPHAEAIRQTADASGSQQGSELSAQQIDETQTSEEAVFEGAGKGQGLSSINIVPSHRQSEMASSDSATSDPLSCQWRIAATREERIRLEFTHMGMVSPASDPSNCIEEYVEVRDGYHSGSPLMGRYCGTNLPQTLFSSSPRMLIEYARSAGQQSTGFAAKYTVVCGGYLRAEEGTFNSPGYPDVYLPNRECTWVIEVPAGFSVALIFDMFELEEDPDCSFDRLEIYDSASVSSPMLRRLCGTDIPEPILSTNNTMTLTFRTNDKEERQGFAARFAKVDCGGHLKANQGIISSPGYPREYPPNANCTWLLEVPFGFSVVLTFESFELGGQLDCLSDYVEVGNGPLESSRLLRKICGTDLPAPIRSTWNTMTLRFVTGNAIPRKGFKARFEKVLPAKMDSCETTDHGCEHICVNIPDSYRCQCHDRYTLLPDGKTCRPACGGHLMTDEGTLTSPNYPNNYPPNINCTWVIEVPVGFSVVLTFDNLKIEGYGDCQYDYVEVFDGPSASSPVLRKICGIDVPPTIQSRHNTMAVRFVTDDVYQNNGFAARFEKSELF
ncbi:hypothetical protein AAHC03_016359 [Spirometra sp. Aus1]